MPDKKIVTIIRENVQKLRDLDPELQGQRAFGDHTGVGEGTIARIAHEQPKGPAGVGVNQRRTTVAGRQQPL